MLAPRCIQRLPPGSCCLHPCAPTTTTTLRVRRALRAGEARDLGAQGVFDLYSTKWWALKLATEAAVTVLRIDQVRRGTWASARPGVCLGPRNTALLCGSNKNTSLPSASAFPTRQIIMAKMAGGPKPRGGGGMDDED